MPTRPASEIRNVVLVGAGGAGKTTLSERLLFATGGIKKLGSVADGTTVSDFTDEEKAHKHSLQPSLLRFEYEGHLVNLLDTPGLADFAGHTIACFPAAETIAVVVDATRGIDSTTRRLMGVAADRKIPRMVVVNKIDEANVDLASLVEELREEFGAICLPINLPKPGRADCINVFEHTGADALGDASEFSSVHEAHKRIVEQVIEVDDELTMAYLEHGEKPGVFDEAKLHAAFEKALEDAHLIPVCFVSAKTGAGVDDLLHILATLCPSPVEVNPPEFEFRVEDSAEPKEWHATPDPNAKLLAHVFRVVIDPFLGKIAMVRVHQGTLRTKHDLLIDDHKKPVKVGHLFLMQGKEHTEVSEIGPGAIGAIAKVDELVFNSVLHDSHELDSVALRPLPLPRPMYGLAIELKNPAEEAKFAAIVHKLMAEDPCLKLERIAATGQTVLRSAGELHMRIVLEKLKKQAHVELLTSPPKVAYKETITTAADGHHRHKKQTGGAGQFGEVALRIEPLGPGEGEFEFVNSTVGGSIPRQFIPAVEKGVRQVLQEGAFAGYPMTGLRVSVVDGKYHDVDSKEIAFIAAARKAFKEAVAKARPALMEPFVTLEVTAPGKSMGDIAGHLSTKRGRVLASEIVGNGLCVVRASAPLSELQTYGTELKSMTGGAGTFTMDYSHDERTPAHVQQAVISAYRPREEE